MEQLQLSCSMLQQPASSARMSPPRSRVQGVAGRTSGSRGSHVRVAHSRGMIIFSATAQHDRGDCRQLLLASHSVERLSCALLERRMMMKCYCRDAWHACRLLWGLAWTV